MKHIFTLFCISLVFSINLYSPSLIAQTIRPTRKLPIIESRSSGKCDYYVIFLTGNGGWQNLVRSITHYLNERNISVVAINTKKYLWSEKGPAQIGCDLESLMSRYDLKWGEKKVVFIGFSMGAEVLPFAVNCMDHKFTDQIDDLILISPWQNVTFKVRLRDFYSEANRGADLYTELLKIKREYVICDDTQFSIAHKDLNGLVDHVHLGGGHHFGGDYHTLSILIGKRLNLE